jgi:hypothetical protein
VWRQTLALLLTLALTVQLPDLTRKSYLELLEISPGLRFSERDYENAHDKLEKDKESEQDRLEKTEDTLKDQIKASRKQLDSLNKSGSKIPPPKKMRGKNCIARFWTLRRGCGTRKRNAIKPYRYSLKIGLQSSI